MVDLLKRFLNCCNVAFIPMLATLVTTAFHWVWLWLFMNVLDFGVIGIPLASFITYGLQVVFILIYANSLDCLKEVLFWPTMDVF